jgi:hypothetical protein
MTSDIVRIEARLLVLWRYSNPPSKALLSAATIWRFVERELAAKTCTIPSNVTSSQVAVAILDDLLDRQLLLSGPEPWSYLVHPALCRIKDPAGYEDGHAEYLDRAEADMKAWRQHRGKRRKPDEPPASKGWPERERRMNPAVRAAAAWMYGGRE